MILRPYQQCAFQGIKHLSKRLSPVVDVQFYLNSTEGAEAPDTLSVVFNRASTLYHCPHKSTAYRDERVAESNVYGAYEIEKRRMRKSVDPVIFPRAFFKPFLSNGLEGAFYFITAGLPIKHCQIYRYRHSMGF